MDAWTSAINVSIYSKSHLAASIAALLVYYLFTELKVAMWV